MALVLLCFFQPFRTNLDGIQESGNGIWIKTDGSPYSDSRQLTLIDKAIDRQRLDGQPFGERLYGIKWVPFHVVPSLHCQDGGVDVLLLETQILDRRIDVPMPQRLLSPEDVPAQRFIDPIRKGLSHAMRCELAG